MNNLEERSRVVEVAKSWLRTPYFPCAQIKGRGCDCGSFLAGVYAEASIIEHIELGNYDWMAAWAKRDGDAMYLKEILGRGQEIAEADAGPGDVVMYRIGRGWSHAAIVIDWPRAVIHAVRQQGVMVTRGDVGMLKLRGHRFFSPWRIDATP